MSVVDTLVARALSALRPPPELTLSQWAEENFVLADRGNARPGRFRLWPYQRGFLDAIGDPEIERVTVIKSARIGFTKCLMAGLGAVAATNPCAIILLVPTDDDARGFAVDEVEPAFEASPALANILLRGRLDGRNTLTMKVIRGGGSLKILSARSPRNLRRHDAKVLFVDEADGMEITAEGDPISLAEKRTLAHPDRKIVVGSTPTVEGISVVDKLYGESDQRTFQVPCPSCGTFHEIAWSDIRWPEGEPDKAAYLCPTCQEMIEERFKPQMIEAGEWIIGRPEVKGHAGFRINAMVSLLANASWKKLAGEFLQAKRGGPADLQVFVNTVEGRVWKNTLNSIDETSLMARAQPISLDSIPDAVLVMTVGADVQDDRVEMTFLGWSRTACYTLAHHIIWGSTLQQETWDEVDAALLTTWKHPKGGTLKVDAAAVDSGGHEGRTQQVYNFTQPRLHRRIYAIKGVPGAKPVWEPSKNAKVGVRLFLVGVDQVKTEVTQRLAIEPHDSRGIENPGAIHISDKLPEEWFDQVTGERRFVRYVRNRAVIEFKPKRPGQRVEALDCMVYGFAARHSLRIDLDAREAELSRPDAPRANIWGEWAKRLNKT